MRPNRRRMHSVRYWNCFPSCQTRVNRIDDLQSSEKSVSWFKTRVGNALEIIDIWCRDQNHYISLCDYLLSALGSLEIIELVFKTHQHRMFFGSDVWISNFKTYIFNTGNSLVVKSKHETISRWVYFIATIFCQKQT